MADLSESKQYGTARYPINAQDTSGLLTRCEPLLTPDQLKRRFLKGINLTAPNGDTFTEEDLKDRIKIALNDIELDLNRIVTREQFSEKKAFDHSLYRSFIHLKSRQGPIVSLERLAITSANQDNIFEIPAQWIEPANFHRGQINVIPLLAAFGVNSVQGAVGNAGIAFLAVIDGLNWVPAYWEIKYTAGLSTKEGHVPILVNKLAGTIAAIDLLSEIAAQNTRTSYSLNQDGIGKSEGNPGPQKYAQRIKDLENDRARLTSKLKGKFSSKFWVGTM